MTEREMYDRLLELAGGCRHEWGEGEWYRTPMVSDQWLFRCAKCSKWYRPDPDAEAPAVGDGSQMSLGELVRLAKKLGLGNIFLNWLDDGRCWVQVGYHPTCFEAMGEAFDLHEELALAAAILAAVDGEQA